VGKNVTIYLPDEVAQKMALLPEVNWSEICRQAITGYVETRVPSAGSAATFQLEKPFQITNPDNAAMESLRQRFKKTLQEMWDLGTRVNITRVNIDKQPKLFYHVKKLGQTLTAQATVLEFISVNQDLQVVRLKVFCGRDPSGMLGSVTGEETALTPQEIQQYGLSRDRMTALIQGVIAGDIY
jgi:hypothetical protein